MSDPSSTLAGSSPTVQNPAQPAAQAQTGSSTAQAVPAASTNQNVQSDGDIIMNGRKVDEAVKTEDESSKGPDLSSIFTARREEEIARKDRSLAEFLVMLDGYKPLVSCPN